MYESMVDVLIYLYENYMDGDSPPPTDQNVLREELVQAGFSSGEIEKALLWLDELADGVGNSQCQGNAERAIRVYTDHECSRMDVDARGMLLFLEQNGILDTSGRELVIDRALALDTSPLTVDEMKWIVLLVLMNQPGQEAAFTQMEDIVYNENPVYLH